MKKNQTKSMVIIGTKQQRGDNMTVFEMNNAIENAFSKVELVAAYIRVSTQEQKLHGLSLDAQRMKLTEYAENNNMKIVEWYVDEGVSGRKLIRNRPELQRMLKDAQKGDFSRILFIKLDRFFRSVAEYHEMMKQISPVTWTATEEDYDLTTANGRMLVNMKLTIAELEADQTGERINIVNEYKVSTGQPLSGSLHFCWKIVNDEYGRKKIIKHPEHREAMEDLLNYIFRHQSKRKAVVYLHTKHHISLSYNSLCRLLKDERLCGEYRGNLNYCDAYLTREEFDKLQEITTRNVKNNTANREYIFSGLIKCPNCGSRLAGAAMTSINKYGTRYKYKKYRCANHRLNNKCDFCKPIGESTLEKLLLANIEPMLEDVKIKSASVTETGKPKVLKYSIEDINEEIDRLNYSWKTGKIRKVEQYEKDYDELLQKLELAEAEQNQVTQKDFSHIEAILNSGWKAIYNNLDDEHKRAFWRSIISSIEVEWTTEKKALSKVNFY